MYRFFTYFSAGISLCFVVWSHTCFAGGDVPSQIRHFDLPSNSLSTAIIEFALQAKVTVIVDQALLQGRRSAPLIGPHTTEEAIATLLAHSGLVAVFDAAAQSYSLHLEPNSRFAAPRPTAPPEITVEHEELIVTAPKYPFRYNTITNTQTLGDIPYFDSARFLNVLPHTLIEDQQALEIGEVTKYASSITPSDGFSDSNDDMVIRGFQRHANYIDGYRLSALTGVKILPVSVSQVEILKGPSTVYFGQAEPGGVVNIVRKKPDKDSAVHAMLGGGSNSHRYGDLDINFAFNDQVYLRTIAAHEQKQIDGDVRDLQRSLASGALTWQPYLNTTVDVGYLYQSSEQAWVRDVEALTPYGADFPGASIDELTRNARDGYQSKFNLANLGLHQYINSRWRVAAKFFAHQEYRYGIRNTNDHILQPGLLFNKEELGDDFFILIPGGQVSIPIVLNNSVTPVQYTLGPIRSLYDENEEDTGAAADLRFIGDMDTGFVNHRISFGVSYQSQKIYKRQLVEVFDLGFGNWYSDAEFTDVLLQGFEFIVDPERPEGDYEVLEQQLEYSEQGLFLQDNLTLHERVLLTLGTRYTVIAGEHVDLSNSRVTVLPSHEDLSSQLGLVYRAGDNHSLFANYSESLKANFRVDDAVTQIESPELSHQFEAGLKSLFLDGALMTTLAYFDISKNNVIDLRVYEGVRTLVVGDDHSATGVDFDLTWQLFPSLNMIAAYAWLTAEVDSGDYRGNRTPMSAEHTSSLFANYRYGDHFSSSIGVKQVGGRFADLANDYYLHGYTTWDASASYRVAGFSLQPTFKISVKNIADTVYHTAIVTGVRENYSAGRSVLASLELAF